MPGKLPLLFSEPFDAPVWQINSSNQFLAITNRDQEKRQVYFSLFDLRTKSFIWKDIQFEDDWWVNILGFLDQRIIFQVVVDEDIERKIVFGFDMINTTVEWVSEEVKNPVVIDNEIYAIRPTGEHISIDPTSGEIREPDNLKRGDISHKGVSSFHYTEGTKHFEQIQHFVLLKTGISISGACDYAEVGNKVIISFFGKHESGTFNRMLVVNQDGEILHQELLSEALSGVASDTFFIVGEALIFVKNRNELVGLIISE